MLHEIVIATTKLDLVAGKETRRCFTGSPFVSRDEDYERWLPEHQPEAPACTITTVVPSKDEFFTGWAGAVLGVSAFTPLETLVELLEEREHLMTLAQGEEMVAKAERRPSIGMNTDGRGWGNFFFVKNKDEDGGVSLANIRSDGQRHWQAFIYRLDYKDRWFAERRLLIPNLRLDLPQLWP